MWDGYDALDEDSASPLLELLGLLEEDLAALDREEAAAAEETAAVASGERSPTRGGGGASQRSMSQRRLERWPEQHNYSHAEVEQVADRLKVILKQLGRRGRRRADAAAAGGEDEGGEAPLPARVAVGGIASAPHAAEAEGEEAADDDDGTSDDDDDDDVEEAALETLDDLGARVDGLKFEERVENLVKVAGWLERRKARKKTPSTRTARSYCS